LESVAKQFGKKIKNMKKNKVKPTEKQLKTFQHMKNAKSLQEAMLKGGYSKSTSLKPKQNFTDLKGTRDLMKKYQSDLVNAGISTELLAEIQAEGLFDQNSSVRLGYLKETKKDFGLTTEDTSRLKKRIVAEEFFSEDKK